MSSSRASGAQALGAIDRVMSDVRSLLFPSITTSQRLPGYELLAMLKEVEMVGPDGVKFPVDYAVNGQLDALGVGGLTTLDSQSGCFLITLAERLEMLLEANSPEAVEVLCHEVSHLVLHPHEVVRRSLLAGLLHDPQHRGLDDGRRELEADYGARVLIAPTVEVLRIVHTDGVFATELLQSEFGLAANTAYSRVLDLNQGNELAEGEVANSEWSIRRM